MPEVLATFRGPVRARCSPGPLGLTLSGDTREQPGAATVLAFCAAAPADFPDTLADAVVERLAPEQYRIRSGAHEWLLGARAVHLTREVAAEFYRALPPRPVPAAKRFFLRIVLALAASRAGFALLRALRR
jgi:hypothetical protein